MNNLYNVLWGWGSGGDKTTVKQYSLTNMVSWKEMAFSTSLREKAHASHKYTKISTCASLAKQNPIKFVSRLR